MLGASRLANDTEQLRREWMYCLAEKCQLLAGNMDASWGSERAKAVEDVIRLFPRPESPLEELIIKVMIGNIRWQSTRPSVIAGSMREVVSEISEPRLHEAARMLETQLGDCSTSLKRVADAVGLSEGRLNRLFKDQTGYGVRAYLTRLRVKAALRLLIETTESVKMIAAEVGFSSEAHCDRCFNRILGRPPLSFRGRIRPMRQTPHYKSS
jgi:AraC-like DNA-binding protein